MFRETAKSDAAHRSAPAVHRIVIAGGGAGGLELAALLGERRGRARSAETVLVDPSPTHMWKPLLHEVAAGSIDIHAHQIDYLAQAQRHHFTYVRGALQGLDRAARQARIGPVLDPGGSQIMPARMLPYDTLVIAIGAVSNTFGIPGVVEHAIGLESASEADRFHQALVNACFRANYGESPREAVVRVVIVGGGATGVELAAELRSSTRMLAAYGLRDFDPDRQVRITLVTADARLLTQLPQRISVAAQDILTAIGVEVRCARQVVGIEAGRVHLRTGAEESSLDCDLVAWAAGIRGPGLLASLDGLEVNRLGQLLVRPSLQTTIDDDVFAMGDCAACPYPGHAYPVPATAQAAHQQSRHMARLMHMRMSGRKLPAFGYRDFGSLVSFGEFSTVGTLMGFISGKSMRVEGAFARLMYQTLYRQHLFVLHGLLGVMLDLLARLLRRGTEPRVKLH